MNIQILYFARLRDDLNISSERFELESHVSTLEVLRTELSKRGDAWQKALGDPNLLIAVNQDMASWDSELKAGDEVAFFPPVTGG